MVIVEHRKKDCNEINNARLIFTFFNVYNISVICKKMYFRHLNKKGSSSC